MKDTFHQSFRLVKDPSPILPMIASSHHKCLLKELADRQKRRDKTSLAKEHYVLLIYCLGFMIVAPEGVVFYYTHLRLLTHIRVNFKVKVNLGQSSCYFDLRSNFQLDLPSSKSIYFDAS